MAEAGDGSGHTPLTPEWTPAPRASYYPWQGDRPAAAPSLLLLLLVHDQTSSHHWEDVLQHSKDAIACQL